MQNHFLLFNALVFFHSKYIYMGHLILIRYSVQLIFTYFTNNRLELCVELNSNIS